MVVKMKIMVQDRKRERCIANKYSSWAASRARSHFEAANGAVNFLLLLVWFGVIWKLKLPVRCEINLKIAILYFRFCKSSCPLSPKPVEGYKRVRFYKRMSWIMECQKCYTSLLKRDLNLSVLTNSIEFQPESSFENLLRKIGQHPF